MFRLPALRLVPECHMASTATRDRDEPCATDPCWCADGFVPPKPIRELRDLMRYRRRLVETQAAERNRPLKVMETANIKLANVATDVFGMSGRLMLRALIEGKATPKKWPTWPKGFCARRFPNCNWLCKASWKNTIVSCWNFSCNDWKRRTKTWRPWDNASSRSSKPMRRSWPYWTRYLVWIGLWPR
jgi:hypothetical protein